MRKRNNHKKHKHIFIIPIIAFLIILTFFIIRSIEKNIAPSAVRQGEYYSRLTANKIINKAVSDYLTANQYQYNDFSAVLYDENGKAVSI